MKRDRGKTGLNDPLLKDALAVLISCTRTTKRPLPLTDIARSLRLAVSKLGSVSDVADRIGISAKMLRQFSYVDRLNKNVKLLFERRDLDSVDAATHLAMLPSGDQDVTARKLAAKFIDSSDVRAIVQLRKAGAKENIRYLLERVNRSKTKRHFVAEFVIRGRLKPGHVRKAIEEYINPNEIVDLRMDGIFGRIVLTADGRRQLSAAARSLKVTLEQVIPTMLSSHS